MRAFNLVGAVVLGMFLSSCCMMPMMHGNHRQSDGKSHEHASGKVVCPVCQMEFTATKYTPRALYQGQTHYFVSEEHMKEFFRNGGPTKKEMP